MKQRKERNLPEVKQVVLHPKFGMEVGLYLTLLYILIILILIFLLGFLPSLISSGKRVTFTSEVEPASLYVDETYIGTTPVTTFLKAGNYSVEARFDSIESEVIDLHVGRPLFFTWLVPRKQNVVIKSFIRDKSTFRTYLQSIYDQFIRWSEVAPDERYHRPPWYQYAVSTTNQLPFDGSELLYDFFVATLPHIQNVSLIKEAKEALKSAQFSNKQHLYIENLLDHIESLFEKEANSKTPFVETNRSVAYRATTLAKLNIDGFRYEGGPFRVGRESNNSFIETLTTEKEVTLAPFSMASYYVTEYQWALFIQDNPYWDKSNIANLIDDKMVDSHYLDGIYPTVAIVSNRPIRNISYRSALAYTNWLSEQSGVEVTLPSEAQWEMAAASVFTKPYSSSTLPLIDAEGPTALLGGYWEFTSTSFIPLGRYLDSEGWASDENRVVLKGGSYLNDPAKIDRTTVGIHSQVECSETTSFRVVWSN